MKKYMRSLCSVGVSLLLTQASLAEPTIEELTTQFNQCIEVVHAGHEAYLEQSAALANCSIFAQEMQTENEQLQQQLQDALNRSWYERPEILVPVSVTLGVIVGAFAIRGH